MKILVRLAGEIPTKSKPVRVQFTKRIATNIRRALMGEDIEHTVTTTWSRIIVEADDERVLDILTRIFGISSFSRVEHECEPELESIVECGRRAYLDRVRGRTYAVRARRDGNFPFRSKDIECELGTALNGEATVNLDAPDITVFVEVRKGLAIFHSERTRGPGGLPLGSQGRVVSLMSGGFDSAVSSWQMLKRGIEMDYVLCNLGGAAYERAVTGVVKVLSDQWSYGIRPTLHVIDFHGVVEDLLANVRQRYAQIILKRLMYRAAEQVGTDVRSYAIVTGESLGQVSSQTLQNLRAIDEVATVPVLRPLIGTDKEEIMALARSIGTYALSMPIQEYCAVVPEKPATRAPVGVVLEEENQLDLTILSRAVADRKTFRMSSVDPASIVTPYLFTQEISENAVVIDCRAQHHFRAWHYPDAVHCEIGQLLVSYKRLDKKKTYVVYCPLGLQSAVAAEKMQRDGFEAYSFKGGTRAIHDYAVGSGIDW